MILYVETISPTRLNLQYTKAFSKRDKLKEFIALKMTDIITFLERNGKLAIYTGGNTHDIYSYIEMI